MNSNALIAHISAELINRISFKMADRGLTYDEAKAEVKESSCAGPATWAVVDAKFAA